MGNIGAKIRDGFSTAGNWLNQHIVQPVGSWGKGFIQKLSGGRAFNDITEQDIRDNTALRLGSESGDLFNSIGKPIIQGASTLLGFPQVATALGRLGS